jgi:formamidopyrimidine-DNA glycosylase
MPELPEVETVCRGLALKLEGRVLVRVDQRRPNLRIPMPPDFVACLTGRRVVTIRRRAKYILVGLDDDRVLIVHLGMSGRMIIIPPITVAPPPGTHDHVILHTDDGHEVRFNDARRFGLMTLVPAAGLEQHPLLASLGPEPLGNSFDAGILSAALAGISPLRSADTVAGEAAERLVPAIRKVLTDAIAAGGSSLRDYVQTSGELGYFQNQFAVYDREGEACPGCTCTVAETGGVLRIVQSNRSTFFCPRRQH